MLRPAQLYKEKLAIKQYENWYNPRATYFNGFYDATLDIADNNRDLCQFVSVDEDDNVIGYISYTTIQSTRSAENIAIINYEPDNRMFIKDVLKVIYDIFFAFNYNRLEWWCYTDNPACRGYIKLINRFGGQLVGTCHQCAAFPDGSIHDMHIFEILRKDINLSNIKRLGKINV